MGKKWSQVQEGRAAAVTLAEPWEEEPGTFPEAGTYAERQVCDNKKRKNQGERGESL